MYTMLDTEIKVERASGSEGGVYEHESFGMVKISHIHGVDKTFGSEVESTSLVELTITGCQVTQSLGQNWYHGRNEKVRVRMSAVQYAELISNPNSQGSPCTILNTEKLGRIKQKHIETQTQYVESEIERTVTNLHKTVADLREDLAELLDKKGTFKKSDKDQARKLVDTTIRAVNDYLPFYENCLKENIEKMKSEARADINCHIQHAISKTGIAALQDPQIVQRLLENK